MSLQVLEVSCFARLPLGVCKLEPSALWCLHLCLMLGTKMGKDISEARWRCMQFFLRGLAGQGYLMARGSSSLSTTATSSLHA